MIFLLFCSVRIPALVQSVILQKLLWQSTCSTVSAIIHNFICFPLQCFSTNFQTFFLLVFLDAVFVENENKFYIQLYSCAAHLCRLLTLTKSNPSEDEQSKRMKLFYDQKPINTHKIGRWKHKFYHIDCVRSIVVIISKD